MAAREPAAGTDDDFAALGLTLGMAIDDSAAVGSSLRQFGAWLVERVDERCDTEGVDMDKLLRSLLYKGKQDAALTSMRLT